MRSHLLAAVGPEALADDLVVIREHLRVNVLAEAPNKVRGTLNVGEEEGERFDK